MTKVAKPRLFSMRIICSCFASVSAIKFCKGREITLRRPILSSCRISALATWGRQRLPMRFGMDKSP